MDDLGAEQLSQLSASCNTATVLVTGNKKFSESCTAIEKSNVNDSTNAIRNVGEKDEKRTTGSNSSGHERDGNRAASTAITAVTAGCVNEATCLAGNNVSNNSDNHMGCVSAANAADDYHHRRDAPVVDEEEKTDATPENLKKIVDDIMVAAVVADTAGGKRVIDDGISASTPTAAPQVSLSADDDVVDAAPCELRIDEDESPSKQALAFTIDFGDGHDSSNPAVAAAASQRYRNMVERFQNRHRRGASMSKIEDQQSIAASPPVTVPPASSGRTSRVSSAHSTTMVVRQQKSSDSGNSGSAGGEAAKVKMRIRDRSTSGVRDANKRHSWSPRSSTHEPTTIESVKPKETIKQMEPIRPSRRTMATVAKAAITPNPPSRNDRQTNFTPRSTAMQMVLNKVEFACLQPPLDDFANKKKMDDDESVSEAGTYTVDGDNYTEEQKELMNIDKATRAYQQQLLLQQQQQQLLTDTGQNRPTDLPLLSSSIESRRRNNVLEISYYHDSTSLKPKISYLDKIKSRVKNITKSPDKPDISPSDQGTFTSVTTSGVLSKKPMLDSHPRLHRKNSLTKSHIDSSEYISAESALRPTNATASAGTKYPSSAFTDHQKAEYKLNVFSKQTDPHIITEQFSCEATPLDTPESPSDITTVSDTGLKTAQSKNDWIQEWARNARARSATTTKTSNVVEQMSRSFNFENIDDSMLSDPIAYHSKRMDRYRYGNDMEYASDTNLSSRKVLPAYDYGGNVPGGNVMARPPLSPSKIPSPVHTVGRIRTVSRPRGSLQDLSPNAFTPETDIYLQKTAAAISNYAQSLSRKNSLQNSPSSKNNSPRRGADVYPHYHHPSHQQKHYSADEYSPSHHNTGHPQGLHKRHLSHGDHRMNLMSHSLNSEQLNEMLDYRGKQQRERQNSFDASMYSPRRMYAPQPPAAAANHHHGNFIEPTNASIKQQYNQPQLQQSPLRRSSSFSSKSQVLGAKLNQQPTSNKMTSQQSRPPLTNKTSIQKSASSTSFRKMYSDYDDNVEYYINDEDDLVDDYCSSDEFDDPNECYPVEAAAPPALEPPDPLTNTRYNKALLMRIERSKQKVAGNVSNAVSSKPPTGGVMACPNTPEMPRRTAQNVVRSSMRQSVPRDSSLNRLRGEVPNSLASAKKQLLQTATNATAASKKVQPKYMDISKYKTNQTGNFLRKDGSKSTLVAGTPRNEIKRSPSSASVVLNRSDPIRASNRSVKSAGGKPNNNSVAKQKENDLAMWRRRATYDPMKAAAEGRRKQEEAKKSAQTQGKGSESSIVMRSQSFHSGVGQLSSSSSSRNQQKILVGNLLLGNSNSINSSSIDDDDENIDRNEHHRWNESSDECDDGGDQF